MSKWNIEKARERKHTDEKFTSLPQWITGSRLLKAGEKIGFDFYIPEGMKYGSVEVFPHYLEKADPGNSFIAGGGLAWLEDMESESQKLKFVNGYASISYKPDSPGNYIAKWIAGDEIFYRYFSVVENDSVVFNFSTFAEPDPSPSMHATGIPLDYRLPEEKFDLQDPVFKKLFDYHRHYGSLIVPEFPDTPDISTEERVRLYGKGLEKVRGLIPDINDTRSIRVEMCHYLDKGYTETFMRLGIVDHCGLCAANGNSWLGMPEFIYYSSPVDCRKTDQSNKGSIIAHQWDFSAGFHFLGPVGWHYGASEGCWETTGKCLRDGMKEAVNMAEMSGHPAFIAPVYGGIPSYRGEINLLFNEGYDGEPMFQPADKHERYAAYFQFVEKYQKFMAFELTREHKLVFARSIDIADYYLRHFAVTPRTIYLSRTDHIMYDSWWLNEWYNKKIIATRERLPWLTRISSIMDYRKKNVYYKDPLSCEYVVVEDQRCSIRFERECPNPVWWFDYTKQERGPEGSSVIHTETPDVQVVKQQSSNDGIATIRLKMLTDAVFSDYAVILWGLPERFCNNISNIKTSAKEFVIAKNMEGEFHLVLFFDLKPGIELQVTCS